MSTPEKSTPLIAKVQAKPDAAWDELLDEAKDATDRYDPETQTNAFTADSNTAHAKTHRGGSSGGAGKESDGLPDSPDKKFTGL